VTVEDDDDHAVPPRRQHKIIHVDIPLSAPAQNNFTFAIFDVARIQQALL
jgi:hypothetical protein